MHKPKSSLAVAALFFAPAAWSFTLDTVATEGCHERITTEALQRSGWPQGRAEPAPTPDDQVLAQNVQFRAPPAASAWTLSLLIGVRDNDLGGASPTDLPMLAAVQNGRGQQHDHCLRELEDTGSEGDRHALAACRAYIVSELEAALGSADAPDLTATETQRVDLAFGDRPVPVTRYAFHLGHASHALEDSFAHTFRSDDFHTVVSVHTYIGPVLDGSYTAEVDGYPHQSGMDSCEQTDDLARARADATTTALSELYDAMNTPGDRASRSQRVNDVLESWLGYTPGCTAENGWCDHAAPVRGCSATSGLPALMLAIGVLLRRRATVTLAAAMLTGAASAQTVSAETDPAVRLVPASPELAPAVAASPAVSGEVPAPIEEPVRRPVLHFATGLSLDNPGAAFTVGARLRLHRRFMVGADVELAPWFDLISGRTAPGTVNAYASGAFTWTGFGRVEIRSVVEAGTSVLLFSAPGAEKGSVGIFLGFVPVQLVVHVTEHLALEVSPELVVAAPALKGVPLAYRQYRGSFGVQWTL